MVRFVELPRGMEHDRRADITAEQLRSRVTDSEAVLVGPGGMVAVADGSIVGRDAASCDVAVLHASVSVVHARLSRLGGAWTILDLGSRNGTAVDGVPAAPRAPLAAGAQVRLGEVTFLFWPGAVRVQLAASGAVVEVVLRDEGGVVRGGERAIALTGRELRLLALLVVRRALAADPELAYAPSPELAECLGFRSIDADGDNVRELVHRVRRKLIAAGLGDPVKSKRGVGYRLHGDLIVAPVRLAA